jgi:hypothetical protein
MGTPANDQPAQRLLPQSTLDKEVPFVELDSHTWRIGVGTSGLHVVLTVTGNGWQAEHVYWALTGQNAGNPTFHDGNLVIRLDRGGCVEIAPMELNTRFFVEALT